MLCYPIDREALDYSKQLLHENVSIRTIHVTKSRNAHYRVLLCSLIQFFFVVRILYYLQSCLLHAITTYNCAFAKFTVGIIISLSPM